MITMIVLAVLCGVILCLALHPLVKTDQKLANGIMLGCAVLSLCLYLALGSPDLPGAPALFETSGDRHDQRLNGRRELLVLEALSGEPNNVKLLLELGTLRVQSDHPEEALDILNRAHRLEPKNKNVAEALGAAHYKMSLIYRMQPRPEAQRLAKEHLEKALSITPKSSDLYKEIKAREK